MSGRTWDRWIGGTVSRYPNPNACKFVGGDEFLTIAMQAYLAAGRGLVPPSREPWSGPDCDVTWSNAEDFYSALLFQVGERLRLRAIARGHIEQVPWPEDADEEPEAEPARVAQLAGAGRSPAAEGHGCPALSPAVGPAPTDPKTADITTPDSPLFCGPELKDLPVANPMPHDLQTPEETPA